LITEQLFFFGVICVVILVLYIWLYLRYIFLEIRQLTVTTLLQGEGGSSWSYSSWTYNYIVPITTMAWCTQYNIMQ